MFDKPQNPENLIIPAHYEYYEVLIEDADKFIQHLESHYVPIHCDLPKLKYMKSFSNCLELVNAEGNKILKLSPGKCWVVPYNVTFKNPINILTKDIDKKITDILCNENHKILEKHETFNEESFKEFVNKLSILDKLKAYRIINELL